jgi:hypothetical protein
VIRDKIANRGCKIIRLRHLLSSEQVPSTANRIPALERRSHSDSTVVYYRTGRCVAILLSQVPLIRTSCHAPLSSLRSSAPLYCSALATGLHSTVARKPFLFPNRMSVGRLACYLRISSPALGCDAFVTVKGPFSA